MRKFNVKVNGKLYEVEIEEISADNAPAIAKAETAPVPPPAAAPKPAEPAVPDKPKETPSATPAAGGDPIKAPLPGTILSIKTSAGDNVKRGQVLFILEAMKMENEILAPRDGRISAVAVETGAQVESGKVLGFLE